ncbi:hypothetical protein LSM04_001743 [Trypanosoma melophagium]|uniref:uncharacterized protein n=1 Tax=Trypanosoma melophagium TaxID=715481 RepID=UPI003519D9F7|nr:hypothetical protein LSM04_001743 [Trypanosoma melophagium]
MNAEGRRVSKNEFNPKIVESYAFGFTSNTAHTSELSFRSPFLTPPPIREGEDGGVRPVDFSLLLPSQDERLLTSCDVTKNSTSICIVSSECKNGNRKRIGNRAVSGSRFKTARDGVCKPSYKSQLVMALIRRYNTGEVEVAKCNNPLDLASNINQEYHHDGVRLMDFSLGEYMSFRIRRRCFKDAERYRSELLMPYDYDNSGVNCKDLDKDEEAVLFSPQHFSKVLVGDHISPFHQDEYEQPQRGNQNNQKEKKSSDNDSFDAPKVFSANSDCVNVTNTSTSLQKETITPVPSLTDDILTSYNSYEDQSYQPSVHTTLETNNNTQEEKKRLSTYALKSKSYEAHIEASSSTTTSSIVVDVTEIVAKQKEMLNPFETGRNPFYSSMSHSSLVGNNDTNGENGNGNPFNQMHTGYPVILFAPYTNQEENNEEDENRQQEEDKEQQEKSINGDGNITFKPNGGMCTLEVEDQDDIGASNMH